MTVYESTIAKIQQMPEPLVQEVQDYVDFLLTRSDEERWRTVQYRAEAMAIAESEFTDYLGNLEDYEDRLARGDVQW